MNQKLARGRLKGQHAVENGRSHGHGDTSSSNRFGNRIFVNCFFVMTTTPGSVKFGHKHVDNGIHSRKVESEYCGSIWMLKLKLKE